MNEIVHGIVARLGGSFAAEHGLGRLKRSFSREPRPSIACAYANDQGGDRPEQDYKSRQGSMTASPLSGAPLPGGAGGAERHRHISFSVSNSAAIYSAKQLAGGFDEGLVAVTRGSSFAALFIALGLAAGVSATPAAAACAPRSFDDRAFPVYVFDPRHDDIRLFWKGPDARPYGSLAALAEALGSKGQRLAFAMNAGMFAEDQSPVGLYVENRHTLHEADTRGGATNFHMKPNGVFWVATASPGSWRPAATLPAPPPARYATRSGPMLVVNGKIHPRIRPERHVTEDPQWRRRTRCGGRARHRRRAGPLRHVRAPLPRRACLPERALPRRLGLLPLRPKLERDDELEPIDPIVEVVRPQAVGSTP